MNGSRTGRAVYMDWMMRNGHVQATHDLWDDEKEPQEVYNFGMEITLSVFTSRARAHDRVRKD